MSSTDQDDSNHQLVKVTGCTFVKLKVPENIIIQATGRSVPLIGHDPSPGSRASNARLCLYTHDPPILNGSNDSRLNLDWREQDEKRRSMASGAI